MTTHSNMHPYSMNGAHTLIMTSLRSLHAPPSDTYWLNTFDSSTIPNSLKQLLSHLHIASFYLSPLLTTQPQTFLCVKMLLSLTEDQICLSSAISVVVFLYVVLLVLESSWRNIGVSWLTQVDCSFPHFVAERLTAAAVDKGSRDVSCLKDEWEVLMIVLRFCM